MQKYAKIPMLKYATLYEKMPVPKYVWGFPFFPQADLSVGALAVLYKSLAQWPIPPHASSWLTTVNGELTFKHAPNQPHQMLYRLSEELCIWQESSAT